MERYATETRPTMDQDRETVYFLSFSGLWISAL
jgi:hypothetical protein